MSGSGRHVALVTLGNLASPVVALVTTPILAVGLGASGRGELAAAAAPLMLCVAALTMGLPEALTNITARLGASPRRSVICAIIAITIIGAAGTWVIWALAPRLSAGNASLDSLIRICAVVLLPALWCGIPRGIARGMQAWGLVVAEQVLSSALKLVVLVVLFVTSTLTPLTAALAVCAALIVGAVAYLPLLYRKSRIRSVQGVDIWSFVRFAGGVWPGAVAGVVLSKLDQVLILPLSSAAALGVYAVAVSLSDSARMFNAAVRDVTFANQSTKGDNCALALATRLSTMVTVGISLSVLAVSFVVVVPLLGSEYVDVPVLVSVLLAGAVLGNPGSVTAAGLSARGRPLFRSAAIVLGVAVNLILILTLVPRVGALGAALAAAVANALTGQLVLIIAMKTIGLRPSSVLLYQPGDWDSLRSAVRRAVVPSGRN